MELWSQLFSDSVGIASAVVIVGVIIMGAWFAWYFITRMMNDEKAPSRKK